MFDMFGKLFKIVTNWAAFVAYVQTAVITAESDKTATGTQKRDAVVSAVIAGMKADFGIDLTGFESVIQTAANLVVSVFNSLGVFKHSSTTTTGVTK